MGVRVSIKRQKNRNAKKPVAKKITSTIGFLKNKGVVYPSGITVAEVASIQEFGSETNNIPSRPFMRQAFNDAKPFLRKRLINAVKMLNMKEGLNKVEREMNLIGEQMVSRVRNSIIKWENPPNAPLTIKKKGFNNPLVETGTMAATVSQETTIDR
jgi:hypothetical protein